jgi:hypothetical protein
LRNILAAEVQEMNHSDDKSDKERLWKSLSEARLLDIPLEEFPERIKEAKAVVMRRLGELLELKNHTQERQSTAYSLGTLKKLENSVRRD